MGAWVVINAGWYKMSGYPLRSRDGPTSEKVDIIGAIHISK
jgi:hypothetical protein